MSDRTGDKFGVASVRNGKFQMRLSPQPLDVEAGAKAAVSLALNDIHREVASAAGGQSSGYWTAWKQGLHEVRKIVTTKPGITTSALVYEMKTLGNSLYWKSNKAQVRALAEQCGDIRFEFVGREYRYFPKNASPDASRVAQEGT